jgi:hypothetical protein
MSEVAEKQEQKRAVSVMPNDMGLREHRRQDLAVDAKAGTKIEDVLQPQYWAHVAGQLGPYTRIEVLEETGAWMLELLVINCGRNWAKVQVLHKFELEERSETVPTAQSHRVEWKGPVRKFTVIRISDDLPVQDGFTTRPEAQVWLTNHEAVAGI